METFDYDDIQLIPSKCIIESRHDADTSIQFGPRKFAIPVVPANMASVIDESLAIWMAEHNYFYVMHRFTPEKRLEFVHDLQQRGLFASISVGIKATEYQFIDDLKAANLEPEYITIDVAHGHSDYVIKMIQYIKQTLPSSFVIAGNVATPEAVRELENAGADATKVGVGPGKACITKLKTGFGTGGWQLAALRLCSKAARKPLIADGGIRHNGDIAKSVRFGASMVMIGSLMAGHEESPGNMIKIEGKTFKQYWGSASETQKGAYRNVEGKQMLVPFRGSIQDTLDEMQEDLQSSISYAGGRDLESIRKVDYVVVKNSITNGDD
ncbi:guanosine 5-monophosphate oxidoreductase [Paucilactobacillus oligofermentans DSM 15707 = LMG 22743]|uniref:GMP reductase n=1 Tax=Paucilactobacillus oligofermentans DSM 15707 = LMG 22743 TaxID=1423778 RepID=A0A0R1RG23_9LACO|nr:GMP reductase [Paucilactobacillus oligofermentans]KRL55734.1 guanosine 5-monophosphate oxidoreductase [Paucilactobacillus oligofermentans DSM 15707 = LMG 22743]CUS27044.1 Putative GMP reductase [Paucilactobacillus oligofermentans DSM 15707 = LMG 22743]